MIRLSLLCASFVAIACSSTSGSGVSGSKKLIDLTAGDKDKLCAYSSDVEGGPHTVDCGMNTTVTIKSKAECLSDFMMLSIQCQATVSEAEKCFEAIGADPCNFGGGACTTILQCLAG